MIRQNVSIDFSWNRRKSRLKAWEAVSVQIFYRITNKVSNGWATFILAERLNMDVSFSDELLVPFVRSFVCFLYLQRDKVIAVNIDLCTQQNHRFWVLPYVGHTQRQRVRGWDRFTAEKKATNGMFFYLIRGKNEQKSILNIFMSKHIENDAFTYAELCSSQKRALDFGMKNGWMELFIIISTGSEFKYSRCRRICGMNTSLKNERNLNFGQNMKRFRSTDCLMLTRCPTCSNKFHELKIEIRSDPHGSCVSKANDFH